VPTSPETAAPVPASDGEAGAAAAVADGGPVAVPRPESPEEVAQKSATGYRAVLTNPHFLLIWAAQVLSQTAQNVVNYALVVEVERLTQSSANVSLVVLAFSLPVLLLGPSAGVFVDRVGKRGVLISTNVLRALLMAGFLFYPESLQAIYLVTFAASVISQFFGPAEGAILPLLVGRRQLITATSLFNLTFTGAQIAGFILLGPTLYKLMGPMALFVAVVVMYCLAAICCFLLPRRERVMGTVRQAVARALDLRQVWVDMREVRRFMTETPGITVAIAYLALASALLMTLATLGPGFVARVLGLGPEDAGYILAPAGLGMLVTTALIGHFALRTDRVRMASAGLVAMAVSLAALALVRPVFEYFETGLAKGGPGAIPAGETVGYLFLVCLVTFSLGVEFSFVTVPAQTMIAEATEPHLRGRVFALLFMVTGSVSAIPAVVIGNLADKLGIVPMLLTLALLVALVGLAGLVLLGRSYARRLKPHASG
jgi:MFS family permease